MRAISPAKDSRPTETRGTESVVASRGRIRDLVSIGYLFHRTENIQIHT